jgi:DNA-directed DNA polymerase III PolC
VDQFRVRSEFNFRQAFGQMTKVVAAGAALGAKAMALTDTNTFGHVSFYKAAKASGIKPILGVELICKRSLEDDDKRTILLYACNTAGLSEMYGWTTLAASQGNAVTYDDVTEMTQNMVRVAASCQADEIMGTVDFIEVNPSSAIMRQRAIALSKKHKVKLLPTSDVFYPLKPNRKSAELMGVGMKPSPQWMLSRDEAEFYMPELPATAYKSHSILAKLCENVELVKAENIKHKMDLLAACRDGIKRKFPGKAWTKEYEARMRMELNTINSKGFDDYFAVLCGMCRFAKQHMLVGPARGSAAGSLVCYLLDITEVDPIVHDLMFERFIDETRHDFPDVDLDFPDEKRELVFQYLRDTYGSANVAHIGTVSRLKAKSAIGETAKRLGIPPWETDAVKSAMIERSGGDARAAFCLADTFDSIEIGQQLVAKYPAMREAAELEDHAWHSGVHAAGALVCNRPVRTYCTINKEGTAQLDKKDAEAINLMKIDVLGLRTLSVIEATGVDVRNVPLDDEAAFDVLNKSRFTGIFQFEGPALQSITKQIGVHHFEDIVAITSLARPGPLHSGGATSFINRKKGIEQIEQIHPIFNRLTAKTQGMVLYQEQVMMLLREVGNMEWADVQMLRRAMSKSLGLEFFEQFYDRFLAGARANKVPDEDTRKMWELMIHFGSYGFNRSHAVAYAIISYWCAWLKAHHPLEFACAALMHAKDEDQAKRLLREIVREGQIGYIPFDRHHSQKNWTIHNGKILAGLTTIKGVGEKMADRIIENRATGKFTPRQEQILSNPDLQFADLFPAERMYGDYYRDPEAHGVRGKLTYLRDITNQSEGSFAIIAKMNTKDIRDLNETSSLARRGGKVIKKDNLFMNLEMEDDTDKIIATIGRFDYSKPIGKQIRDAPAGSWWIIRGNVRLGFRKLYIQKIRRLS